MGRPKSRYVGTEGEVTIHEVKWADNESNSTIAMHVRLKRPIPFTFGELKPQDHSESEGARLAIEEAVRVATRFIIEVKSK